ncbi:MAG: exosortase H-associated membrane protein [Pseudomonadota bacterium]
MTSWLEQRPATRFLLTVLALLPTCFVIWHLLGSAIAAPSVMLSSWILLGWLPGQVIEVGLQDTDMLLVSAFSAEASGNSSQVAPSARENIGYLIDTRTLSYSIPFYTALHGATRIQSSLSVYSWNLLVLWVVLAVGLVATGLKDVLITEGNVLLNARGMPPADLVAVAYQTSSLLAPTLVPVILWAYAARRSDLLRSLLPGSLTSKEVSKEDT